MPFDQFDYRMYAHDVDNHFALKKQRRLLSKARKLLINADHNLTVTVGIIYFHFTQPNSLTPIMHT
jgi:hypothetical protein